MCIEIGHVSTVHVLEAIDAYLITYAYLDRRLPVAKHMSEKQFQGGLLHIPGGDDGDFHNDTG